MLKGFNAVFGVTKARFYLIQKNEKYEKKIDKTTCNISRFTNLHNKYFY